MISVAAYCRVSTDKDDQTNSFHSQQQYFREYIAQRPDWNLFDIYADEGITGTSTKKRKAFNQMILDAKAGKFQLILTKEISRFSRNILDTIQYTRQLKSLGVGVLFVTENINTLHPETEMLMTFMGTIAQEESRRTSLRVKWGQTRRMEQGVVFGRSLLGYTVKNGEIHIQPDEAEIVRLIFQKYTLEGKGTSKICRELMAEGYRTSTGNPVWNSSHIIRILRNEKYAGDLIQKKSITPNYLTHEKKFNRGEEDKIILLNHHEPIISRALWDRTQKELEKRNTHREGAHSRQYGLSGKIICGKCGCVFTVKTKYTKDGETIRRWCCYRAASRGREGCNIGKLVRDEDALDMVKSALQALAQDDTQITKDVAKLISDADRGDRRNSSLYLLKELNRLKQKKRNILDACFSGDISREEMLQLKEHCDKEISVLENRLEAKRRKETDLDLEKMLRDVLFFQIGGESLCKHLVERITVFPDRHIEVKLRNHAAVFYFVESK